MGRERGLPLQGLEVGVHLGLCGVGGAEAMAQLPQEHSFRLR